jgi:hypothetical protein
MWFTEACAAALKSEVITELRQVYDQDARARQGSLFSVATPTLQANDYERYAVEHDGVPGPFRKGALENALHLR